MRLIPYPGLPHPLLSIDASVETAGNMLLFRYRITGDVGTLRLAEPATSRRADDLWRATCFEAFVRSVGGSRYREFNFAPSGEWAAYSFAGYRSGREDATVGTEPGIAVTRQAGGLAVDVHCSPGLGGKLELNLAAVIETEDGEISYWALAHASGKPDFHDPACFALTVQA
jgi:hypothetical protein